MGISKEVSAPSARDMVEAMRPTYHRIKAHQNV
jgi:hypothetical protein